VAQRNARLVKHFAQRQVDGFQERQPALRLCMRQHGEQVVFYMLIIDEIQHLLSCSAREQRAALNMIKFLSNDRRMTIVAAGTHEALHVMRFDPQIASRFEQMEPAVWTESEELRRFVAGYLAMLPLRKDPSAIDQRFIEYLLALTDGVTGRIIDLLRRAAIDALTHKSKSVGLDQLLVAGANLPAIINQRAEFPI
jgi:Cdc6-like AAA superfamily ATPase